VRLAGEQTINNYVSAPRSAMDLAVLDKLLSENRPTRSTVRKWRRSLTTRTNFAPTVANLIAFRFFSGLRTSEMVALRWQSIDWSKMQVLIHEAVVKGLRKQTKTNKARLVSLNSRALDALERQKEQTPRAQLGNVAGDVMRQTTQGFTDGLCRTDAWRALG
jgi:integrase